MRREAGPSNSLPQGNVCSLTLDPVDNSIASFLPSFTCGPVFIRVQTLIEVCMKRVWGSRNNENPSGKEKESKWKSRRRGEGGEKKVHI